MKTVFPYHIQYNYFTLAVEFNTTSEFNLNTFYSFVWQNFDCVPFFYYCVSQFFFEVTRGIEFMNKISFSICCFALRILKFVPVKCVYYMSMNHTQCIQENKMKSTIRRLTAQLKIQKSFYKKIWAMTRNVRF